MSKIETLLPKCWAAEEKSDCTTASIPRSLCDSPANPRSVVDSVVSSVTFSNCAEHFRSEVLGCRGEVRLHHCQHTQESLRLSGKSEVGSRFSCIFCYLL